MPSSSTDYSNGIIFIRSLIQHSILAPISFCRGRSNTVTNNARLIRSSIKAFSRWLYKYIPSSFTVLTWSSISNCAKTPRYICSAIIRRTIGTSSYVLLGLGAFIPLYPSPYISQDLSASSPEKYPETAKDMAWFAQYDPCHGQDNSSTRESPSKHS